jgi:ATP-dependent exoDNAse (exonuclease V) beta subunit
LNLSIFENQFDQIHFDEKLHRYRVNDPVPRDLISTTTILGRYSIPFDSEAIAEKTAKKRKVSKESLIEEWAKASQDGADKGTNLHTFIELLFLKGEKYTPELYSKEKIQIENFWNEFVKPKKIIWLEKVLYHLDFSIAGTIDALMYCESENTLYFIDWKSNKKIAEENRYQKLKFPLNRYDQCSKEIYTLQISIYRWIIEEIILNKSNQDFKCKNLLVHFNESNENYKIYELPYYRYSVIQLLNHYNLKKE